MLFIIITLYLAIFADGEFVWLSIKFIKKKSTILFYNETASKELQNLLKKCGDAGKAKIGLPKICETLISNSQKNILMKKSSYAKLLTS